MLASGESVLASDYLFTSGAGAFEDTGLSVSLPAAGTYLVSANVRIGLSVSAGAGWLLSKLHNSTDSTDVANSERLMYYVETAGVAKGLTVNVSTIVTVAGAKTIKLYGARASAGGATYTESKFRSDAGGRTTLSYVRLN